MRLKSKTCLYLNTICLNLNTRCLYLNTWFWSEWVYAFKLKHLLYFLDAFRRVILNTTFYSVGELEKGIHSTLNKNLFPPEKNDP